MGRKALDELYSWDELAEQIANRIEQNITPKNWNRKEFIEWFMLREKLGGKLPFDYKLVFRCYLISNELRNQGDHFVVIVGKEGSGKSWLSMQMASWVAPSFTMEDICYSANHFLRKLLEIADKHEVSKKEKTFDYGRALLLDEGGLDLFSRDAISKSNKSLAKTFFIQRFLNTAVFVCVPNFFLIDSVLRKHRVKTLICVIKKGQYKGVTGKGLMAICNNGNKFNLDANAVPLSVSNFWLGVNRGILPSNLDGEAYENQKLKNIKEFLKGVVENTTEEKMLSVGTVSKRIGLTHQTVRDMVKRGEIEGKTIGKKWFVTNKAYEKLINTNNKGKDTK